MSLLSGAMLEGVAHNFEKERMLKKHWRISKQKRVHTIEYFQVEKSSSSK